MTTAVNEPELRMQRRGGFSLIEVIIAMVILAVGVLGLAGTTAFVIRQVTLSDVNSERSAALQYAMEGLRAMRYNQVGSGSLTVDAFTITWAIQDSTTISKNVRMITTGPGLVRDTATVPRLGNSVADTFNLTLLKP